jgi:hypothetical protein
MAAMAGLDAHTGYTIFAGKRLSMPAILSPPLHRRVSSTSLRILTGLSCARDSHSYSVTCPTLELWFAT